METLRRFSGWGIIVEDGRETSSKNKRACVALAARFGTLLGLVKVVRKHLSHETGLHFSNSFDVKR